MNMYMYVKLLLSLEIHFKTEFCNKRHMQLHFFVLQLCT